MKWVSHILIAGAVCAVFNPAAVPAAALGSTAPDWFERLTKALGIRNIHHRGVTHYLAAWVLVMLAAHFVWDWNGWIFWFAAGGAVHWVCDALTISGAPLGWWSDRRMTLFGGKVLTGSVVEYVITAIVVTLCAVIIFTRSGGAGFVPFFYKWGEMYDKGVVDGIEWKHHRFDVI